MVNMCQILTNDLSFKDEESASLKPTAAVDAPAYQLRFEKVIVSRISTLKVTQFSELCKSWYPELC